MIPKRHLPTLIERWTVMRLVHPEGGVADIVFCERHDTAFEEQRKFIAMVEAHTMTNEPLTQAPFAGFHVESLTVTPVWDS